MSRLCACAALASRPFQFSAASRWAARSRLIVRNTVCASSAAVVPEAATIGAAAMVSTLTIARTVDLVCHVRLIEHLSLRGTSRPGSRGTLPRSNTVGDPEARGVPGGHTQRGRYDASSYW